jgi:AraC family transcriptional regulator, arabinose operon regulatory protein
VSNSATPRYKLSPNEWADLGAYANPFSNQGVEFEPVCGQHAATDLALHETGFISRRPHWNYQKVFSPFWRLYYDLEPGHRVIFREKAITLGPDRIVLIPDHQLFHSIGSEPKPKLWIHFSREIQLLPTQTIPVVLVPCATERSLIQDLIRLLRSSKKPVDRDRTFHLSIALLHLVLSRPEIAWQREVPANLMDVVRHIESNYASALYTRDLARLAHSSESVFRRRFQEFRNAAPAQFIAQVRIREAAHLLSTTSLDMDHVAERTGFPNPAYLSRVFKRVTGKTPARFRRESRGSLDTNQPNH